MSLVFGCENMTKSRHDTPWDVPSPHQQIYLTIDDFLNFMGRDPLKEGLIMIFIANDEDYGGYIVFDVNEMMDTYNNGR